MKEKKSTYKSFTEARAAANKRYLEKQDEIKIRVPAGGKDNINQYIVDAITVQMLKDDEKTI